MRSIFGYGILAVGLLISGQAFARNLTTSEKAMIRNAVSERFFDPDSAKFRWLPMPPALDGGIYCGSVNAKNRYGAYTGYNAFAVVVEFTKGKIIQAVSVNSITDADPDVYQTLCDEHGFDIRLAR